MRIKTKDIPIVKQEILREQGGDCAICGVDLHSLPSKDICLDHDHTTGHIRGVLCRNCNSMEGKVLTACHRGKRGKTTLDWLAALYKYLTYYNTVQRCYGLHPTHRTPEEKKALAKKRAKRKKEART
jgi:hypothetical protein